jgi:hypothetical protein
MDWDAYAKYIEGEKPDIVGIGGMTPVIDTSFKAIKIADDTSDISSWAVPTLLAQGKQILSYNRVKCEGNQLRGALLPGSLVSSFDSR